MKKWCALLMTLLLILTTAGAEEFSGGKDFWDDAYRCTVENGYLTFQSDDGTTYQPIAVREGFAKAAVGLLGALIVWRRKRKSSIWPITTR